ncbi:DUF3365 domain-containing protein [Polaribacter sp. Asnod1-A03]|uniref:Tll0287-like domain-containing protein n=1 Tax=Polaribacter sp. Asnod1-A03 TaxID=3160581 RepID=UPI003862D8AA
MRLITVLILFTFLFSCKDSKKPSYTIKNQTSNKNLAEEHPGKKLMEASCYTCHSVTASEDSRLAPPMIAIKRRYINENISKEAFINDIQSWMNNPTEEKAKMYGAVKKYGLMPKLRYPEKTIQQISEYMFDFEIEKPEWFESHLKKGKAYDKKMINNQQGNLDNEVYIKKGLNFALTTKAVLGKNLISKIQQEGALAALKFCNIKAYPLTDSMSIVHNANIKRVSDKPRNLKNKANTEELKYINVFKGDVKQQIESKPVIVTTDDNVQFYYPIKTNAMCLQCHGINNKVKENTAEMLKKLYPNDLALGYNDNEVRGIWSISYNK